MYPSVVDDNGPGRLVWLARRQISSAHEGQPGGFSDPSNSTTNTLSGCRNSKTVSLCCSQPTSKQSQPCELWEMGGREKKNVEMPPRQIFIYLIFLFLSERSDRLAVRTSFYLKAMHWRDLRGEKWHKSRVKLNVLTVSRPLLAMRRSSTLPCLSSSQFCWMRPAGTAPLSDNCSSGL